MKCVENNLPEQQTIELNLSAKRHKEKRQITILIDLGNLSSTHILAVFFFNTLKNHKAQRLIPGQEHIKEIS